MPNKPPNKTPKEPMPPSTRISQIMPQLEPAPFVFAGKRLGQLRGGHAKGSARGTSLVVLETTTWQTELTLALTRGHGIGTLRDDSIVVYEDKPTAELGILPPGGTKFRAVSGTILSADFNRRSRIFTGAAKNQLTLATVGNPPRVEQLVIGDSDFAVAASATLRTGNDFDSLAPLPDGSLVYAGSGEITRLESTGKKTSFHTDVRANHVVAGPTADTVWASDTTGGLHLLTLTESMSTKAQAVGWIYHMASSASHLATIEFEQTEGSVSKAELVLWDSAAKERWRQPIAGMLKPINRIPAHWVATSATQVAVGTTTELTVYDVATGKKLTP